MVFLLGEKNSYNIVTSKIKNISTRAGRTWNSMKHFKDRQNVKIELLTINVFR